MSQDSDEVNRFLTLLSPPLDEAAALVRALVAELAPGAAESVKWRNSTTT